jgi:hypothetical protein
LYTLCSIFSYLIVKDRNIQSVLEERQLSIIEKGSNRSIASGCACGYASSHAMKKREIAGDIPPMVWVQTNPRLQNKTSENKLIAYKRRGCAGDFATLAS